jgi:hypothetical protein
VIRRGRPTATPRILAGAVEHAIAAIGRQLELVKLEFPDLPPRQQFHVARSRCPDAIAAANSAIDLDGA